MHVAKTLIGYMDFGLSAQEAIALPNIFFNAEGTLVEKGTFLAEMAPALARINGKVTAADLGSKVNAVERVADQWRGAADPRSEGVALAQ